MMNTLARTLGKLNDYTAVTSAIAVLFLIAHIVIEIALRTAFNAPIGGTIIFVSYYYMIAICFLALGAVQQSNEHVSVDLLYNILPGTARKAIDIFSTLFSAAIVAVLFARTSIEAVTKLGQATSVFEGGYRIYLWPTYFFLPIGLCLFLLSLLFKLRPSDPRNAVMPPKDGTGF